VACQVQVQVKGPDAHKLVEYLTPRDLSKIVPGQCVYAPLIDEKAGIVNDPIILCLAPDRFWLSISDTDVLLWVKGLAIGAGFDVVTSEPPAADHLFMQNLNCPNFILTPHTAWASDQAMQILWDPLVSSFTAKDRWKFGIDLLI